ncbi:MAG: DUF6677 family protein [Planctomycetota bacterium]|nr:DUF6677 family protein [Planctomycetota bacterium]MEC7499511.1 DUF6677 family protein [Planctomycetota bacterium]MEE3075859.1 DUF6677 family protein [Planctomycetota bacterium]
MNTKPDNPSDSIEIPLTHPGWAAFFGWLIPGAGHFYQGRYAKGGLFFCCILFTFFYGLFLGNGQVVYAAWRPGDWRWQYPLQLGVGIPAMPAIAQYRRARKGEPAYFANRAFSISERGVLLAEVKLGTKGAVETGWYSPPPGPIPTDENCVLGLWNDELQHNFEIATLFTVVAGLLNLLAVYDAFAGPVLAREEDEEEPDSPEGFPTVTR